MELEKYIEENKAGIDGNDYFVAWKPNRYWVFRGDKLPKDPSYTKQFETPFYPISRELLVRMGGRLPFPPYKLFHGSGFME